MTGAEWLLPLGRVLFADAGLKRAARSQCTDRCNQLQTNALRVVFVCLRVAKVDQHTVTHVLRNETSEPLDRLRNASIPFCATVVPAL